MTIIIVTHNMQQAARVSDYTAFMYLGEIVEYDKTDRIFTAPSNKRYIQEFGGFTLLPLPEGNIGFTIWKVR